MVLGCFEHITFKLTSCCAAQILTGPDHYRSMALRLGTPVLKCFSHGIFRMGMILKEQKEARIK